MDPVNDEDNGKKNIDSIVNDPNLINYIVDDKNKNKIENGDNINDPDLVSLLVSLEIDDLFNQFAPPDPILTASPDPTPSSPPPPKEETSPNTHLLQVTLPSNHSTPRTTSPPLQSNLSQTFPLHTSRTPTPPTAIDTPIVEEEEESPRGAFVTIPKVSKIQPPSIKVPSTPSDEEPFSKEPSIPHTPPPMSKPKRSGRRPVVGRSSPLEEVGIVNEDDENKSAFLLERNQKKKETELLAKKARLRVKRLAREKRDRDLEHKKNEIDRLRALESDLLKQEQELDVQKNKMGEDRRDRGRRRSREDREKTKTELSSPSPSVSLSPIRTLRQNPPIPIASSLSSVKKIPQRKPLFERMRQAAQLKNEVSEKVRRKTALLARKNPLQKESDFKIEFDEKMEERRRVQAIKRKKRKEEKKSSHRNSNPNPYNYNINVNKLSSSRSPSHDRNSNNENQSPEKEALRQLEIAQRKTSHSRKIMLKTTHGGNLTRAQVAILKENEDKAMAIIEDMRIKKENKIKQKEYAEKVRAIHSNHVGNNEKREKRVPTDTASDTGYNYYSNNSNPRRSSRNSKQLNSNSPRLSEDGAVSLPAIHRSHKNVAVSEESIRDNRYREAKIKANNQQQAVRRRRKENELIRREEAGKEEERVQRMRREMKRREDADADAAAGNGGGGKAVGEERQRSDYDDNNTNRVYDHQGNVMTEQQMEVYNDEEVRMQKVARRAAAIDKRRRAAEKEEEAAAIEKRRRAGEKDDAKRRRSKKREGSLERKNNKNNRTPRPRIRSRDGGDGDDHAWLEIVATEDVVETEKLSKMYMNSIAGRFAALQMSN